MTRRFKVAAVQVAAGQIAGPVGDLARLDELTAQAAGQGVRLVVWPECAYPAYFLRSAAHYRETADRRLPFDRLGQRLAELARRCSIYLAAGVVEELPGGGLANAAMVFGPDGTLLTTYRKCFLWHFDNDYFTAGQDAPVIETELGRLGVMICADGRCPELAAIAGRQRAQIIVNPTAWVSWGRRPESLTNPQIEYFIPARAMENGCWILSANKIGVEADSVVYCGRSNLVDPTGKTVASLDSQQEGVLLAEVDLDACRQAAQPEGGYPPILFNRAEELPVTERCRQPLEPGVSIVVAAVAGADRLDPERLLADLAAQSVRLVIVQPGQPAFQSNWMQSAQRFGMILHSAATGSQRLGELGVSGGSVASFAPARAAMLDGCDLFVADPDADGRLADLRLLRGRAAENRIYLASSAADGAVIIGPTGAVLAETLAGRAMAAVARLTVAAARDKEMASGTDVVAGRNPALYAKYLR